MPELVSKTLMRVPLVLAVATLLPCTLIWMMDRLESWAAMSRGGPSALWRSTRWMWPGLVPGMASTELSQLGLRLQRPLGLGEVSNMWSWVGALVKVNTLITFSSTTTIRSLRSLTANTSEQNSSSMTIFFFKSSQIPTLFAGDLGRSPPPTIAM